jgi:hypothetical protein
MPRIRKRTTVAAAALGLVALALTALTAFAGAGTPPLSDTLGLDQIAALHQLPTVATVPPGLQFGMSRAAQALHGDAVSARGSLRRLRESVGVTQSDLYVYQPTPGTLCLVLWQRQGTCSSVAAPPAAGALYLLSPGGSGYVGASTPVPPEVAGVVSDGVNRVDVTIDQSSVELPIVNNSFAYEVPEAPTASFTLSLDFGYSDGSSRVVELRQEAPPTNIEHTSAR